MEPIGSCQVPSLHILSVGNLIRFFSIKDQPYIKFSLMSSYPPILKLIKDLQLDVLIDA